MTKTASRRHVGHWMSERISSVGPDAPLSDALEIMNGERIRHVVVVEGERLLEAGARLRLAASTPIGPSEDHLQTDQVRSQGDSRLVGLDRRLEVAALGPREAQPRKRHRV